MISVIIKVLDEDDNMEMNPKLFFEDWLALPLLSVPIETQPEDKKNLIAIPSESETKEEIFNNARVTHA
uniref:Uncharacterized protein n=1 Tax=Eufriesea mexicana TaxID=516756 RepID=A0A310SBB0_9HYME